MNMTVTELIAALQAIADAGGGAYSVAIDIDGSVADVQVVDVHHEAGWVYIKESV